MLNRIEDFRNASCHTKSFVMTIVIMGIVIVGAFVFAYGAIDARRSGPPRTEQHSDS